MNSNQHPVQQPPRKDKKSLVPKVVSLKAYEVYRHLYDGQEALITGDCRGGFSFGNFSLRAVPKRGERTADMENL